MATLFVTVYKALCISAGDLYVISKKMKTLLQ